jgi:hypothetical protein
VIPEFKRDVKIIDSFPENFALANGTNLLEAEGYGGSYLLTYSLKVVEGEGVTVELPKPHLFLDDAEINLSGETQILAISSK